VGQLAIINFISKWGQDVCLKILFRGQGKTACCKNFGGTRLRSLLQSLLRLGTPKNVFPSRSFPCPCYFYWAYIFNAL